MLINAVLRLYCQHILMSQEILMSKKTQFDCIVISVLSFVSLLFMSITPVKATSNTVPPEIIDYLGKMKSASGHFIQIGPDGVISEGEFALRKPGKMYFGYEAPTPLKVVSDGFWVSVEDKKLKTQDKYPLSETPLSILLSDKPDFSGTDYKIAVDENEQDYLIKASDPKHPERGDITLAFSKGVIALNHWIVTDAQGLKTIVNLQNVNLNVPTKNSLFFISTDNGTRR